MKKHQVISLFFIFIFPGITSQAQVRIFGGPQLTTAKYSIQNVKQPTNSKVGFMAGIGLTTAVEGPVYFSPSISYSRKGYKVVFNAISVPPDSAAVNDNTSINTLSIAPLLQVNLAKAESHFLYVLARPLTLRFRERKSLTKSMAACSNRCFLVRWAIAPLRLQRMFIWVLNTKMASPSLHITSMD